MIFGKNRAFLYPAKVLADTNIFKYAFYNFRLPNKQLFTPSS